LSNKLDAPNHVFLHGAEFGAIEGAIITATSRVKEQRKVLLVIDGIDMVLAAGAASTQPVIDMLSELREVNYVFRVLMKNRRLTINRQCTPASSQSQQTFHLFNLVLHHWKSITLLLLPALLMRRI
jgi:hypothetical protein